MIRMHLKTHLLARLVRSALLIVVLGLGAFQVSPQSSPLKFELTPDIEAMLNRISADSLRGHLSFIASDLLAGRDTPSPGLSIAAEYIAAQFRRAGLEPAGDDGYFQTANWLFAEPNAEGFELSIRNGKQTINVGLDQVSLSSVQGAQGFHLPPTPLVKVDYQNKEALAALQPEQIARKVVVTEIPDFRREDRARWAEMFRAQNEFLGRMRALQAAMVVSLDRANARGSGLGAGRLIDPENPSPSASGPALSLLTIHDRRVIEMYDAMAPGEAAATLSLHIAAPVEKPVKLRNVIGLLRGSDPALKESYVLVTAHYDHIGVRGTEGDRIYNGANDDGSGTVSVIELAAALASHRPRPKRSLVFMTFFGEEKGLLGSRYYGRHPVFPIEKTIANVNLEQVGRTDSMEGPQLASATLTGFDLSDLNATFKAAGELTGIKVYKHEVNSDSYFGRSDNQALANLGVPAHTLCVAFDYPDYHGAGDHWDKIDYDNMARVNRMVALALMMIAESAEEPRWNEANPKAARYVQAWKERRNK